MIVELPNGPSLQDLVDEEELPAVPAAYEDDEEGEYEGESSPSYPPLLKDADTIEFTRAQKKISDLEIIVENAIRIVDLWYAAGLVAFCLFWILLAAGTTDVVDLRDQFLVFYILLAGLVCWFIAWSAQEVHPLFFDPFEQRKWDEIEKRARKEDERIEAMDDDEITSVMESVLGPRKYEEKKKPKKDKDEKPKPLKKLKKMKAT